MEFHFLTQLAQTSSAIIRFHFAFRSHRLPASLIQSIPKAWRDHPAFGLQSGDLAGLEAFLAQEEASHTVLPPMGCRFKALEHNPPDSVQVVILGQDPYHGAGQAHGLAFSVLPGVALPPSLRNILKEWRDDLGHPMPSHGCLEKWSQSGVLLFNSVLTVREGKAQSHAGKGWEAVVGAVLRVVVAQTRPVLFLLWGNPARKLAEPVLQAPHGAIACAHPSPLSAYRGFLGSKPFSRANAWRAERNLPPIDWKLD
jgi:uracil-DNA glycosylase